MKISLIMATVGRTSELERCLHSLMLQTYTNFELVIVDQNSDDRISRLLSDYNQLLSIKHIKSKRGLSRARNAGLLQATGEIIAFPDDDCWYPTDLLERIIRKFLEEKVDGLAGRCTDDMNRPSVGRFSQISTDIDAFNVWQCAVSVTIFLRRNVISAVGKFDETLGVGSETMFQSGEETDFILRALKANFRLRFFDDIVVHHPNPTILYDERAFSRAYYYGCGFGFLMARYQYPIWFKLKWLVRPLGGVLLSFFRLNCAQAVYRWHVFRGRLQGMLSQTF